MKELKEAGDEDALSDLKEDFQKKSMKLGKKMSKVREKEKLFRDNTMTGHVWVYLQK